MTTPEQPAFLAEVEHRIDQALGWEAVVSRSDVRVMAAAARHLCLSPGAKRARPRMIYMFGQSIGAEPDALADVSVAAELIHSASLMHDDVVDEGALRRGRVTVNAHWDNLTAVLTGDLLLSEAIYGLRRWKRPITDGALQVVADMSRAAMLEAHVRGRTDISIDQWRYIARGKTGSMFRWCGQAVGWIAEDDDARECFGRFGERFGVAFQMADDLKDILGGEIGKDRFADVRNGNPSYTLIEAMRRSEPLRRALEAAWAQPELRWEQLVGLGQAVIDTGATAATCQALGEEIAAAVEALGPYRDRPGCAEIAAWSMMMWRSFAQEVAV